MPSTTIQFFEYEHLPQQLQAVAKPIAELAHLMEDTLPDGPEKSAGMRKLLEAKDCFVRTRVVTKEQKIQRSRIDGIYQACRAAEMATLGERDALVRKAVEAISELDDFELSQHKSGLAKLLQVTFRDLERMLSTYRSKQNPITPEAEKTAE